MTCKVGPKLINSHVLLLPRIVDQVFFFFLLSSSFLSLFFLSPFFSSICILHFSPESASLTMQRKYSSTFLALVICILGFYLLRAGKNESQLSFPNYELVPALIGNRTLGKEIAEEQLLMVNLSFTPKDCAEEPFGVGTRCPAMSPCHGELSKLSFCIVENFIDSTAEIVQTIHFIAHNENQEMSLGYPAFEGRIFQVDDIYLDGSGNVFDDKIALHHGGCPGRRKKFLHPAEEKIAFFPEGIVAVHLYTNNYYHVMGEMLPGIFQARQFILDNPQIPLIVKWKSMIHTVLRVLRLENVVKVLFVDASKIIHLGHAYVPPKADCFKASHAVWREFRNFYFDHSVPEILGKQKPRVAQGLKIVVAKRTGPRTIDDLDILMEKLRLRIPGGEIGIFTGKEEINRTMEMFSNTTIFVGAHGAGHTNMMFMPDNGVILEILPDGYLHHCYGLMAAGMGLEYHMVPGSGNLFTNLIVDLDLVVDKVVELAARFVS